MATEYIKDKLRILDWYIGISVTIIMGGMLKGAQTLSNMEQTLAVHTEKIQRLESDFQEMKGKNEEQDKAIYGLPRMSAMLPERIKIETE